MPRTCGIGDSISRTWGCKWPRSSQICCCSHVRPRWSQGSWSRQLKCSSSQKSGARRPAAVGPLLHLLSGTVPKLPLCNQSGRHFVIAGDQRQTKADVRLSAEILGTWHCRTPRVFPPMAQDYTARAGAIGAASNSALAGIIGQGALPDRERNECCGSITSGSQMICRFCHCGFDHTLPTVDGLQDLVGMASSACRSFERHLVQDVAHVAPHFVGAGPQGRLRVPTWRLRAFVPAFGTTLQRVVQPCSNSIPPNHFPTSRVATR